FDKVNDPSVLDKSWLNKQLQFYHNPKGEESKIPENLTSFISYYIEQRGEEISKASKTKFNVIKNKMERFEEFLGQNIMLSDINESFKQKFSNYYDFENYSQNTKQREFNIIKTFCRYAVMRGVSVNPEALMLKFQKEEPPKIYLSFEELEAIENADLEHDYLKNARDWLIVSCYTGQRISDFMRFTKDMIREENGKMLLEFKQQKTKRIMTIPLLPKVLEVLDRHHGNFPRPISDQRYNDYIKVVAEKSGIDDIIIGKIQENISGEEDHKKIRAVKGAYPKHKLVTSHIGRRSFATNYYGKIPTTLLINVTGHSTEAMFLNYIGKSNKDLALELSKYF
ncbi:MAG: site-specific integrase, partial [Algicola sp.]|nr:site-specific integrase [Algicola sp.]